MAKKKPSKQGQGGGFPAEVGLKMGRTWALTHGSAWVLAQDLLSPPHGIFSDYKYWQSCQRALARVNIFPEEMEYDGRSKLYRLDPGVVEGLLQWGRVKRDDGDAASDVQA